MYTYARESLGCVRSRTILCRPVPNPGVIRNFCIAVRSSHSMVLTPSVWVMG